MNLPILPIYDGKLCMTDYLDKVKEYEILIQKDKYNKILNFINEICESKENSLTQIQPISLDKFTNSLNNKKIIKKYCNELTQILYIDANEIMKFADESYIIDDNDGEFFTISLIKKLLNTIDYSLMTKYVNDKLFYIIRNRRTEKIDNLSIR